MPADAEKSAHFFGGGIMCSHWDSSLRSLGSGGYDTAGFWVLGSLVSIALGPLAKGDLHVNSALVECCRIQCGPVRQGTDESHVCCK